MGESPNNLPFINAAIVPPSEKAPVPLVVSGRHIEGSLGAVSAAATVAARDGSPVIVDGVRAD